MSKRVSVCVLLLLVAIGANLGVLNWNMVDTRERANKIEIVSEMQDQMLGQGIMEMDRRIVEHKNQIPNLIVQKMPSVVSIRTQHAFQRSPYTGKLLEMVASGVVIREDGAILTAAHVVDRLEFAMLGRFWVEFADGTEREVLRVTYSPGMDPDVGILWIDPEGLELQPVELVWGNELAQGEQVLVLGNPEGNGHSASTGIISSERITDYIPGLMLPFIQVDSPINGGNSGGPVFDMDGIMVGIVSWLYVGADGLSFLVPIGEIARGLGRLCPTIEVVLYGETQ